MFCRKCGKEIKGGGKTCPYCGAKTEETGKNTVNNTEKTGGSNNAPKTDGRKKTNTKMAVPVATAFLVLIIGIKFLFF